MNPELPLATGEPEQQSTTGRAIARPQRRSVDVSRRGGPVRRSPARWHVALVAALALALAVGAASPAAADGLDDQKKKVQQQLDATRKDMDQNDAKLDAAEATLTKSQTALKAAQTKLAQTQKDLAAAKKRDAQMAAKLKTAQASLASANQAVATGQAKIATQKQQVGLVVRTQFQQQTNLLGVALLARTSSADDLSNRLQWSSTVFDATQSGMNELQALQVQLQAAQARQTAIETEVAQQRKQAADQLAATKKLEQQAATDKANVAAQVTANAAAQKAAAAALAASKKQYSDLQAEQTRVNQQIAARIAAEKAAEARAAAKRKAARQAAAPTVTSAGNPGGSGSRSAPHHAIWPVIAPITSPYGMRFHPILHIWELHDGTDFGASCGTPILSPYAGTITQEYYNVGYGNRLIIDNGKIDGKYVTTSTNHAERYIVHVGQHVKQGQVLGYVGQTGYATGCHLHLMVWLNGTMVNPMTWF